MKFLTMRASQFALISIRSFATRPGFYRVGPNKSIHRKMIQARSPYKALTAPPSQMQGVVCRYGLNNELHTSSQTQPQVQAPVSPTISQVITKVGYGSTFLIGAFSGIVVFCTIIICDIARYF
jgi:hypothetical protein